MRDLVVSVPDHCLTFYLPLNNQIIMVESGIILKVTLYFVFSFPKMHYLQ